MKTKINIASKVTEAIMAQVSEKLRDIETYEYNRTFEAVYNVLSSIMKQSDNPYGAVLVPDNDWAFMAKVTALPTDKKRRFYKAIQLL